MATVSVTGHRVGNLKTHNCFLHSIVQTLLVIIALK